MAYIPTMLRVRFGPATFVIAAVVAAAIFTRLGMWQIDRLEQRRAGNRLRSEREHLPVLELDSLPMSQAAVDGLAWRRVRARGALDYRSEIVVRGRSREGSPGVYVVTPLHLSSGASILVLRGWLPAADGVSADLVAHRPAGPEVNAALTALEALAVPGEPVSPIAPRHHAYGDGEHLVLGSLAVDQASAGLGLPLPSVVLLPVSELSATSDAGGPWQVEPPPPSEGPHLMYAVQWFGFALISLAGAIVYLNSRRSAPGSESAR